jgi:hypothetical protein
MLSNGWRGMKLNEVWDNCDKSKFGAEAKSGAETKFGVRIGAGDRYVIRWR